MQHHADQRILDKLKPVDFMIYDTCKNWVGTVKAREDKTAGIGHIFGKSKLMGHSALIWQKQDLQIFTLVVEMWDSSPESPQALTVFDSRSQRLITSYLYGSQINADKWHTQHESASQALNVTFKPTQNIRHLKVTRTNLSVASCETSTSMHWTSG